MASAVSCDSPVRRFNTQQLAKKENSPVEVNRLKSLLRKKVGDDVGANGISASPKKTHKPKNLVNVKGVQVLMCSSCADINTKDLDVEKSKKNDGEKKKRNVTKKTADSQGQEANPAAGKEKKTVAKKPAVQKPRETKKKAGAQGDILAMPSTSDTASCMPEGTVPTDSVNQAEGGAKPKRQRKKVNESADEASTAVGKEKKTKSKTKEIIKVKVPAPRKTTKKLPAEIEKAPFENMDVTDLMNSIRQSDETLPQKTDDKQKSKKIPKKTVSFDDNFISIDSLTNEHGTSGNSTELKSKRKNEDTTKTNAPKPKKTTKKSPVGIEEAPFKNMDVTDLINSTYNADNIITENSAANAKKKSEKTTNLTSNSSSNNVNDISTNNNLDIGNMLNNVSSRSRYSFVESFFDFDVSDNQVLSQVRTEDSPGDKINLSTNLSTISTSTNISRDNINEVISMNTSNDINVSSRNNLNENSNSSFNIDLLNRIGNTSTHSSFHLDQTFPKENLPNHSINNMSQNVTNVRGKKGKKNQINANVNAENTTSNEASVFTQNDSNVRSTTADFIQNDETFFNENQQLSGSGMDWQPLVKQEPVDNDGDSVPSGSKDESQKTSEKKASKSAEPKSKNSKKLNSSANASKVVEEPTEKKSKASKAAKKHESPKKAAKESNKKLVMPSPHKSSKSKSKNDESLREKDKKSKKCEENGGRVDKKKKISKKLRNDLKVAKAMEDMSKYFSRISIGPTIGTINKLHIGNLLDDSDSSSECSSDCSCQDFSSESSGDQCKCYRCLMDKENASDENSDSESSESSSSDDSTDESSSESSDGSTSSSSSSAEETRRSIKKRAQRAKIIVPSYKEKISKYRSKYDLRDNPCQYNLRSHDH